MFYNKYNLTVNMLKNENKYNKKINVIYLTLYYISKQYVCILQANTEINKNNLHYLQPSAVKTKNLKTHISKSLFFW